MKIKELSVFICLLLCKNCIFEVYASVLWEINAADDDVTVIPGKSRMFYVQQDFQKLECK